MKGKLLDIDHDKSKIILYMKTKDDIKTIEDKFLDYFYLIPNSLEDATASMKSNQYVEKVEKVEKIVDGKEALALKVFVKDPSKLSNVREIAKNFGETREYDINITEKYMLEKGIYPMRDYEIVNEKRPVFKEIEEDLELKTLSFDIETYNPGGSSNPEKDPVIMISYYSNKERGVLTWKDIPLEFIKKRKSELDCISALEDISQNYDILYTYNGDNFDLPYLKARKGSLELGVNRKRVQLRKSRSGHFAEIPGRPHFDVFHAVSFLEGIGAIKILRYTLEDVYKALLGKEKVDVDARNLWERWDKGGNEIEELAIYSLQDAKATWELGEYILPLFVELSRLTGKTLYHANRVSASHVVESLLIREAFNRGELIPKKPKEGEVRSRIIKTYAGGYVKQPIPGLHENIAVLDFRSLYPSIVIAHNIDPFTLDKANKCKEYHESPNGYRFCKGKEGLLPSVLKKILKRRFEIKKEMKKKKKNSSEYRMLHARQWSLKIAANATYGYLGFARARWYSKECAEAITAWGRHYVGKLISEAEAYGFEVLYADTDSAFLKIGEKKKDDVIKFLEKFNSSLPEFMEVELEGFYKRGIFVTRKVGRGAAKKRYALLSENGEMKITGLEFVRTDWSELAKGLQKKVLRLVLEGKVEEAKQVVKEAIADIRKGDIPIEDYVIYTQLKQNLGQYEAIGPHVKAAKRLKDAGHVVVPGMLIGYIVTRGGGSISDRSYPYFPVNLLGKRKPDPEYYINNQVLPAVMKILREIGAKEEDLTEGKKQSSLKNWF